MGLTFCCVQIYLISPRTAFVFKTAKRQLRHQQRTGARTGRESSSGCPSSSSGYLQQRHTAGLLRPEQQLHDLQSRSEAGGGSAGREQRAGGGAGSVLAAAPQGAGHGSAGSSARARSHPAARVGAATHTSHRSYQLRDGPFPGLFSAARQTEAAEAGGGRGCRAVRAGHVSGPCRRAPLRGHPWGPGRSPDQKLTPPAHPKGENAILGISCGRLYVFLVFFITADSFCLAHHFLASVQPSASVAKGHKFLQDGNRNCLLHKSTFPHTWLLTPKLPTKMNSHVKDKPGHFQHVKLRLEGNKTGVKSHC